MRPTLRPKSFVNCHQQCNWHTTRTNDDECGRRLSVGSPKSMLQWAVWGPRGHPTSGPDQLAIMLNCVAEYHCSFSVTIQDSFSVSTYYKLNELEVLTAALSFRKWKLNCCYRLFMATYNQGASQSEIRYQRLLSIRRAHIWTMS